MKVILDLFPQNETHIVHPLGIVVFKTSKATLKKKEKPQHGDKLNIPKER